jgi:O-antigen/teichoic acid export membrane protein
VRRNAAFLLAGRLASAITTVLVLAVVSRTSGPAALGEVGLGLAMGTIAATISDLGTASLLVREAARDRGTARSMVAAGLVSRVVVGPFLLAAAWAVGVLSGAEAPVVVLLVAAGLVAQQTAELTRSVFNAQQRMAISGGHAVVENLAWAAVVCGALLLGADLTTTFLLGLGVWLASILAGFLLIRMFDLLPAAEGRGRTVNEIVRLALPFGAFSLIGIIYNRIDTVLLGLLLPTGGLVAAGSYYAAARLISAFEYLPDALSRAAFPQISKLAVQDPDRVRTVVGATATSLLALACLGPVVFVTGADTLMDLLLGASVEQSSVVLAALSLVLPFRFLAYLFGMTLTSSDAQGRRVLAASLALVAVLAIDLVGIPIVGIGAAVAGSLAAAAILFATYAVSVARRFGSIGLRPSTTAAIVGAMVVAIAVGLVLGVIVPQPLAATAATAVYVVAIAGGPLRPMVRGHRPLLESR